MHSPLPRLVAWFLTALASLSPAGLCAAITAARGVTLPYQVSVIDNTHWTYEPHVAMRVTRQMLEEARVVTLPARQLTSITLDDIRLTSLHYTNGSFRASVFIDATYEGDLMAMAGVNWTISRA
jgi:hypothetical protein